MRDKPAPVGATWFTNLSDFQVQAIEGLNFAIRDDEAEATIYRTQFCLSRLGVTPMVKAKMLRKLILACRRSDLAFLYFLLEACYKGAGFEYSERIIMAGITYLDLEMTMRELDRILPPGVERLNSKSSSSRETSLAKRFTQIPAMSIVAQPKDFHARPVRSPYFMPLPKPKLPPANVSNFGSRPPNLVVTFPFWPAGERPRYKVNEESRWFAHYKFQPVRRMLLEVVGDIMTDYWTQVGGPEVDKDAPLCMFHQKARRQEELVQKEALVKAHQLCLALVDITTREDAALRKRIVAQLDRDIEACTLRWQRLRQRHMTEVMLIEDHDQMCAMGKVPTAAEKDRHLYMSHEADVGRLSVAPTMSVHQISGKDVVSQLTQVRVSDPEDDIPCPIEPPAEEQKPKCPSQFFSHTKPGKRVSITPNIVHGDRPTKCKNQGKPGRFFKGPRRNGLFVFHYHEIPPREGHPAPRDVMRRQALRSLRVPPESCSTSDDGYNGRMRPRDQVVAAIVECAKQMWFGSLEAHQRAHESSTKSTNVVEEAPCAKKVELDWTKDIQHFNPDDHQLMDRLLRDGFATLRKDPRCVFASFPNSHKSNVMREWIKRRYGKTYSYEEIGKVVQKSLPTFTRVENSLDFAPSVRRDGFRPLEDTFDDHDRLMALAKEIKIKYRNPLNDHILALTRICWGALNSHLVTGSSLLNSFFAYLPVRYADMLR